LIKAGKRKKIGDLLPQIYHIQIHRIQLPLTGIPSHRQINVFEIFFG
jgi:hypothetical protein